MEKKEDQGMDRNTFSSEGLHIQKKVLQKIHVLSPIALTQAADYTLHNALF